MSIKRTIIGIRRQAAIVIALTALWYLSFGIGMNNIKGNVSLSWFAVFVLVPAVALLLTAIMWLSYLHRRFREQRISSKLRRSCLFIARKTPHTSFLFFSGARPRLSNFLNRTHAPLKNQRSMWMGGCAMNREPLMGLISRTSST